MYPLLLFLASVAVALFCPGLPYRVAYPTALLVLFSLRRHPRLVSLALLFSCVGDVFGSINFIGQLGAFACCHITLIIYFILLRKPVTPRFAGWSALAFCCLGLAVCWSILPSVQDPVMKGLVIFYAACIVVMAYFAFIHGNKWQAAGALFFVLSDSILGWNRFVSHLPQASLLILVPYYAAQGLIYWGSVRKVISISDK